MQKLFPQVKIGVGASVFLISSLVYANGARSIGGGNAASGQGSGQHSIVDYKWEGFSVPALEGQSFKPRCLKEHGLSLLVLDPGHDDSSASRRSIAKVRGESRERYLWPKVHEGQLNSVSAWVAFETILRDPSLTAEERDELRTMIRFSRYPGERTFAQYEKAEGYYSATQGTIDYKVTNRRSRVNAMLRQHRVYSPAAPKKWAASFSNLQDDAAMVSVHANSSTYFNEGDHTVLYRPRTIGAEYTRFLESFRQGLASEMAKLTQIFSTDLAEVRNLKSGLKPTFEARNIDVDPHWEDLAMLRSGLGSSQTLKVLLEGFVMNGKAGNLAQRQLSDEKMNITFYRHGTEVQKYLVSDVYIQYGQSIARSVGELYGCR